MLKEYSVRHLLSPCGRVLRLKEGDSFRNFLRMEPTMFDELLHGLRQMLGKQSTWL